MSKKHGGFFVCGMVGRFIKDIRDFI